MMSFFRVRRRWLSKTTNIFFLCALFYAGHFILETNRLKPHLRFTLRSQSDPKSERLQPIEIRKRPEDKSPEFLELAKTMKHFDETVMRCAAEDMGCFSLLETAQSECECTEKGNLTLKSCLDMCFGKRDYSYAGMRNEKCYCSKSVNGFVVDRSCDASCSISKSKDCASTGSIRVHRKTGGCFSGDTTPPVSSYMVGCRSVQTITSNMTIWTMPSMTMQQCILKCESIGRILAMPILRYEACICSDLLSMFSTPEIMQTAIHLCDETTQEKTDRQKYPIYKTFVQECGPKAFLRRKEWPLTVLTSFWGSGNTWLRYLIEITTGIYTGSIYLDDYLYRGGMLGEMLSSLSGRTIVVKDHIVNKPPTVSKAFTSAILIIRNPYDAALAEFARFQTSNNHTAILDPKLYESQVFRKFVKELPAKWISHATAVFDLIPRVLVVYYEDLRQDSVQELRRIISFLPQKLLPNGIELERRLMCMKLDSTGNFKRGSKGIRSNPFDFELHGLFDGVIAEMKGLMLKQNKSGLPASYFEPWDLV